MSFKNLLQFSFSIVLSSILLTSCLNGYFIPKKQLKFATQFAPFDAIIVPGIPYQEKDGWDLTMQTRVLWAVYLYEEDLADNIIFSGSSVYSHYFESEIMRLYAIELGVPDSVIYTEKQAKHGVENMYYSYIIARELGFENIALATDPAQTLQVGYYGRPFSDKVSLMPADLERIQVPYNAEISIEPSTAINPIFTGTYEDEPILKRLLRSSGRAGIKKKMKKYLKMENKSKK